MKIGIDQILEWLGIGGAATAIAVIGRSFWTAGRKYEEMLNRQDEMYQMTMDFRDEQRKFNQKVVERMDKQDVKIDVLQQRVS